MIKKLYQTFKRFYKLNSHNKITGALAGFGRAMHRLYENRNHDIESNGEVTVLKKLARTKPQCIFDVGANIGEYTLAASQICDDANIYAFEPVKETFNILIENLKEHQNENIEIVNKGLSSEAKKQSFNIYPSHAHASAYEIKGVGYKAKKRESVELMTGNTFARRNNIEHIDLLKIDVEGGEMDVSRGGMPYLENKQISLIQFEYGYINITTKVLLSDFYDFFQDLGYAIGKIYPKFVDFRAYSFKHEDFMGPNFMAVDKEKQDLIGLFNK